MDHQAPASRIPSLPDVLGVLAHALRWAASPVAVTMAVSHAAELLAAREGIALDADDLLHRHDLPPPRWSWRDYERQARVWARHHKEHDRRPQQERPSKWQRGDGVHRDDDLF
jgi:hypothetical protein